LLSPQLPLFIEPGCDFDHVGHSAETLLGGESVSIMASAHLRNWQVH
jgi:hypothetical protein